MKKLLIVATLFVSAFAAQPALADEPRLMCEDAPSFVAMPVVPAESHEPKLVPPRRYPDTRLIPPVRRSRPEVWIQ